ncbi:hypothetical protein RVU17_003965 [Shigella flexneri]|uniref:Uncharacterized protein n=1 Tax=Shigella flexneri TaxID=623 RepID=A0A658Z3J6_SHIFL|nr:MULTISPECIES: hypothetical protein [Enterobacteriaceae]EFR0852673.1 hypothetical protein [Shigella sonnei]EIQ19061.1 hypothetical protein SFK1770_0689 [Shigella flexneri K-1770]HAY5782047.1 hypothetical protein [Shigella flexneri 3b]AUU32842.1 hypothetical protein MC63_020710 [Shigella flexneri]EAA0840350.1 hypothetical protein [Shigella flexneri]
MLGDNPNIDVVAMVPIIIVDMKIEVTLKLSDITVGNIMSAVSIMAKDTLNTESVEKRLLSEKCMA